MNQPICCCSLAVPRLLHSAQSKRDTVHLILTSGLAPKSGGSLPVFCSPVRRTDLALHQAYLCNADEDSPLRCMRQAYSW